MAITSQPMSLQAGREYHAWAYRLSTALRELIDTGEAPTFAGIDDFLELSARLADALKSGAEAAARSGQQTFTVEVPFTDAEQRMLSDMGSSLLSYVEILTMRGKFDATMSDGVQEAIAAMAATTN